MRETHLGVLAVVMLCGAGELSAGFRPSFNLEVCAWNATDILVMVPAQKTGVFRVVEAIEGDTPVGTELVLSDLSPPPAGDTSHSFYLGHSEDPPQMKKGDRVVVFLRRPGTASQGGSLRSGPKIADGWQPAGRWGADDEFHVCAAWIQDGAVYAFRQFMNPGPSVVARYETNEAEFRSQVSKVLTQRQVLDHALGDAPALAAIVRSNRGISSWSALQHLETGGNAGAEELRKMLRDESLLSRHAHIVDSLVQNGVKGLSLAEFIDQETAFWSKACPSLPDGWLDQTPHGQYLLQDAHYHRMYALLEGVQLRSNEIDLTALRRFAAAWDTCPPSTSDPKPWLHNPPQEDQITHKCDLLLSRKATHSARQ